LRSVLRFFYYLVLRMHDWVVGPHNATMKRLIKKGRVTIGPHTLSYSLPTVRHFIHDETKLTIGDYCSLHPDATVFLGGRHSLTAVTTYPHRILWRMDGAGKDGFPTPTGDSFIGSDVWLCPGALVVSGVRIGHGAIIGAGAVVTKDVPDYAVVGGNPARVIRFRFSEEQIKALLEIQWWDWPEEDVRRSVPLLAGSDIDAFIDWARRGRKDPVLDEFAESV
jgi:acetyltransferase-like isoleucine patch superfamily enzyme